MQFCLRSRSNVTRWRERKYSPSSWVKCRPLINVVLERYTRDLYLKQQHLSARPGGTGSSGSLLGLSCELKGVPRAKNETKVQASPTKEASGGSMSTSICVSMPGYASPSVACGRLMAWGPGSVATNELLLL